MSRYYLWINHKKGNCQQIKLLNRIEINSESSLSQRTRKKSENSIDILLYSVYLNFLSISDKIMNSITP